MAAKPFDASAREMIELGPAAWLAYLGISVPDPSLARVIDSDLSTLTAEADKVIWVDGPAPWIVHIELQASRDARLEERLHRYNALLSYRHEAPVRSAVVLLRPEAEVAGLTGTFDRRLPGDDVYTWFRYDIVRAWRQPVGEVLAGDLPVLPLAPLADVVVERLPEVLVALSRRLSQEASPEQAATLWSATRILLGLRLTQDQVDEVIERVHAMILGIRGIEESSVYQSILAQGRMEGRVEGRAEGRSEGRAEGRSEGRVEEAHSALQRLGTKRFGTPSPALWSTIAESRDLDYLNDLLDRVLDVSSWEELVAPEAD